MNLDDKIKISVLCFVYNHEKYLDKCLSAIMAQNTSVRYEVIVHDDCSTDGTRDIIRRYYEEYPDIIVPIFEAQNLYSQGINIGREIVYPRIRGKYIAMCEGDDYWCDENKLQLQYEYMEGHPECAGCFHNTRWNNLLKREKNHLFNSWQIIYELTPRDVIVRKDGSVHTSSFFFRSQYYLKPDFTYKYCWGDYSTLCMLMMKGTLVCIPKVMSVYNYGTESSYTLNISRTPQQQYVILNQFDSFMDEFNKFSEYKYDEAVRERKEWLREKIGRTKYTIEKRKAIENNDFKEFVNVMNKNKEYWNRRDRIKNRYLFLYKIYWKAKRIFFPCW